jgi:hypothetical protein
VPRGRHDFKREPMMKRISFMGVAIGNITDIVATNVVLLPVTLYIMAGALGGSPSGNPVTGILARSALFIVASSVLGGLCSVLGGHVSARIAKHDHLLNGALSSILCIAIGVYGLILGSSAEHPWLYLADIPLSPALGALGGFLCLRRHAGPRQ